MSHALTLTKWLAPAAALFALACALFAPAEAVVARQRRRVPANVRVQPEAKPTPPAESTVRGRVVYDDTTRPVRRARVMLIDGAAGHSEHGALTDARGDFRIRGVPAGSYYAFVDAPGVLSPVGFVTAERPRAAPGLPDLGEGRAFFDLIEVDGKQDVTVTVRARRGAAIAGRVTYADGDPAVNVTVSLMRRSADGRFEKYMAGGMPSPALPGPRTDDRGAFRMTGLPPGEYLVGVTELIHHGGEGIDGGAEVEETYIAAFRAMFAQHLLMTFHPSATSAKEAAAVKVEAGDERADVDITIPERVLRTVSGVVRARRGGAPVAGARLTIERLDDSLAPSGPVAAYLDGIEHGMNGTTSDEQGRWQFVEIPDGDYSIGVKPPRASEDDPLAALTGSNLILSGGDDEPAAGANSAPQRPKGPKRFYAPTRVKLDVSGGDVSEFVVEVSEGARIAGTISVEGGAKPAYWQVSVVRLGEGGESLDQEESEVVGTEGNRFAVEGLSAGKFLIQPTVVGGDGDEDEEGPYLKSITWNGRDLLRTPLELAEGAEASGVRIVYGRNPATLHVTVRGAAGRKPAEEFFVALVPPDLAAWSAHAQSYFCETEGGACDIPAPPGEYRVLAIRPPTEPEAFEQEIRRRAPNAARVTLRVGETSRVELDAPGN